MVGKPTLLHPRLCSCLHLRKGSQPNADLNPGKPTVMAYLLYYSLAAEQGTCQTPQETPLLMNAPLTSHPGVRAGLGAVGLAPSTQPGVLNEAISELSYKWHPQTGPSPSDPPGQLPQPIHALCSTPNLRLALEQERWNIGSVAGGQRREAAMRPGPAAPALCGEAILSAGHGPALHDSRDGTPSQSVTGQEMLPQLPADVSL